MVHFKTILGSVLMFSSLTSAVASAKGKTDFEGLFEVEKACELTNVRIQALTFFEREGTEVALRIDDRTGHLLISNYYKEVLPLPMKSKSDLKHFLIKDYYKKGSVQSSQSAYQFKSSGSLITTCSNQPLPGKRLCKLKWDDALQIQAMDADTVQIRWKFDKSVGTCSLKRVQ